jgi:hypothetical protein
MTSPAETVVSSTATQPTPSSPATAQADPTFLKDFRYLPIPKRLRYDPDKPFHFGMLLNVSFGIGSTLGESLHQNVYRYMFNFNAVVANLYYSQPILSALASQVLSVVLTRMSQSSTVGFFPCHV